MIDALKRRIKRQGSYDSAFKSPSGAEVLKDLIHAHYVLQPTFHQDPNVAAFQEGQRAVVMRILSILNTTPEEIEKIARESKSYE